jgi:putative Mn2+ efflux pump MntP
VLWLSAMLIAWVSNLDNLAAGFAFGMRDRRVMLMPNVVIALVTMAGTAVAVGFGRALSRLLPVAAASAVGSLIIIAIGAGTILASLIALRRSAGVSGQSGGHLAARPTRL